jgi:aminoglycoside phosphotransferase (APT) family kinase protein
MGDRNRATGLPEHLESWISQTADAHVAVAQRIPGGGRKQAWRIQLTGSDEPLFFRWDPADPTVTGDPWTVRREATIYGALNGQGLPVARLIGMHPTEQAMLATWIGGSANFSAITDPLIRDRVATDFMEHLAALHAIDPKVVGLIAPDDTRTCSDFVKAQLDEIRALITFRGGEVDPVLALTLSWLSANIPSYDGPKVIVQGDTGPGNFLFAGDRVTAIVDWELAHVGDPMDDLAWVSLRSTQDHFPDLDARFSEYAAKSGHQVDPTRIRFYRVLAETKILALNHGTSVQARAEAVGGGGDVGARLIFGQLHRRLALEALADAGGQRLDEVALPDKADRSDIDDLYDIVFAQLKDVIVPRISDPFAIQRTKGMVRVLKYLASAGPRRAEFTRLEFGRGPTHDLRGTSRRNSEPKRSDRHTSPWSDAGQRIASRGLGRVGRSALPRTRPITASSGSSASSRERPGVVRVDGNRLIVLHVYFSRSSHR